MTAVGDLQFEPVGSHTSGGDYSSAAVITKAAGATKLMIQTIDENLRITLDGSTPTTSAGFQITAGNDPIWFPVHPGYDVTAIEEAATAVPQVQWGK
jgi:hypothetical protein